MPVLDQRTKDQIKKILGDPSLFPDEFTSWIPKQIQDNPNVRFVSEQLPTPDKPHNVDVSGGTTGEPQFQGAWVNFGGGHEPARFWKDPWGTVHVSGMVAAGAVPSTVFNLPGTHRPENTQFFAVVSNGALGIVAVAPNGAVSVQAGNNTYVQLNGISFRAF